METNEAYKKSIAILKKLAWKYSNNNIDEFENMISVGNIAFCNAWKTYDENAECNWTTYFYFVAERAMIDEKRTSKKHLYHNCYNEMSGTEEEEKIFVMLADEKENIEQRILFKNQIDHLSTEAQEIVSIILKSPGEIMEHTKSIAPRNIKGALIRLLREKNWKWKTIHLTMQELKNELS